MTSMSTFHDPQGLVGQRGHTRADGSKIQLALTRDGAQCLGGCTYAEWHRRVEVEEPDQKNMFHEKG